MNTEAQVYRYSKAARRRALLLLGLGAALFLGLSAVIVGRWADLNLVAKALGGVLLLILAFTIRGQLGRYAFRCRLGPEQLEISAPLNRRRIAWSEVEEVRRMALPQVGAGKRWACTLRLRSTRSAVPVYMFDDQLEQAENALQDIARRTPQAQHVGI